MPQVCKQTSKFDYRVEAVPSFMQIPDGSFQRDGFMVNRRTDTLDVLGVTSSRYGLIQNEDLISVAEDTFKLKGMTDYTRKAVVSGSGEKMRVIYDFKNKVKKMAVGDEIGFRLLLNNSFNGTLRASFSIGSLRLICLNGASSLQNETGLTKKHSAGINIKFVSDALEKAILGWDRTTELYDRLATVAITQEQGHNILANLEKESLLSEKLREGISGIWSNPRKEDSARNLWNLFNASSDYLTHEVADTRFELANRTDNNVLRAFEKITRDNARFAKLIAPLPAEIAAVALN